MGACKCILSLLSCKFINSLNDIFQVHIKIHILEVCQAIQCLKKMLPYAATVHILGSPLHLIHLWV